MQVTFNGRFRTVERLPQAESAEPDNVATLLLVPLSNQANLPRNGHVASSLQLNGDDDIVE